METTKQSNAQQSNALPGNPDVQFNLKEMDQIWVAYNHMPYGQVCSTHFETYTRHKRVGGEGVTQAVTITAEEQYRAFLASPHVAVFVGGKLERNKAIVYMGSQKALKNNPMAGAFVTEWAIAGGLEKYIPPSDQPKPGRTDELEARIAAGEKTQVAILEALAKLTDAVGRLQK